MICICGWCRESLGYRVGPVGEETTGICDKCRDAELAKIVRPFSVPPVEDGK